WSRVHYKSAQRFTRRRTRGEHVGVRQPTDESSALMTLIPTIPAIESGERTSESLEVAMRNRTNVAAIRVLLVVLTFLLSAKAVFSQTNQRQQVVTNGKASIQVTVRGRGIPVVFIPSLGRSVHDFDDLSQRMVRSGYQTISPEPRG